MRLKVKLNRDMRKWILAALGLLLLAACGRKATVTELEIVPEPVFMVQKDGFFTLHSTLKMSITGVGQNSPTMKCVMKMLRSAHLHPSLVPTSADSDIELVLNDTVNTELGTEGYLLEVRDDGIYLSANSEGGLLYGVQTLMQMLPPDVMRTTYASVTLPECTILDYPRFEWRGLAVDDSAGVLGKKYLKRLLDVMSLYKLNRLQLASPCVTDTDELAELCEYASARNVLIEAVDSCGWEFETDTVFCREGFYEGLERAREGCSVVMSPADYCSFDRYQADPRYQPTAEAGVVTLARIYAFEPVPDGTPVRLAESIVGGCGRYTAGKGDDARHAEYMLLPRALALAEALWSPAEKRDWGRFRRNAEGQKERLSAKGYGYCEGSFTPIFTARRVDDATMNIEITTEVPNTYIFYTTDNSTPTRESTVYIGPVNMTRGTHIKILPVYKGEVRDSVYEFVIK